MIGIILAMEKEIKSLKDRMNVKNISVKSGMEFFVGEINGIECVLALSGMGKVNAAMCAQTMILSFGVDTVMNAGVAGGIDKNLKTGDIVVADSVAQHDFDTTAIEGDTRGFIPNLGCIKIPTSKKLKDGILNLMIDHGIKATVGTIASGDQFISSDIQSEEIGKEFGAKACDMESGAIGQVCFLNDIDFIVLRAISDSADDNAATKYMESLEASSQILCDMIFEIICDL